jgi:hypothetical protein
MLLLLPVEYYSVPMLPMLSMLLQFKLEVYAPAFSQTVMPIVRYNYLAALSDRRIISHRLDPPYTSYTWHINSYKEKNKSCYSKERMKEGGGLGESV